MEGYYTAAQISKKVKRSNQAIYNLINKNVELGKILPDNTITVGRGKQYSQAVLDWIIEYYSQLADSEENNQERGENEEAENLEMTLLYQEIEHLKEKLDMTEKMLDEVRAEKKDIHQQNGALLMLLAQEKQEKQLLLEEAKQAKEVKAVEEEPKKQPGFFARIFGKNKGK